MSRTARHIDPKLRVIAIILFCIVGAWLYLFLARTLYENTANKHWKGKRYEARKTDPWNNWMVDSCVQLLRTGDLVVRRGDDMTSYMLAQLNEEDTRYSHCGIVVVENGKPYVYHSIGGEDNPDQVIRRDAARQWFSPANNLAFGTYRYDLPDSNILKLVAQVRRYFTQKKMFDMDFDLSTDDRLYCSEMIYKAISVATGHKGYITEREAYGRWLIGVDDLYTNGHTRLICQIKFK